MLKSLLYKNFVLLKKYYLYLILGLLIMNFSLPKNLMIIISAFVMVVFQGICIKSVIQNDNESNFHEFVFASVGEKKYIDNIYTLTIINIILSLLISTFVMYNAGLSTNLIKIFLTVQAFIYSLIWSIQIPISYSKDISVFRIVELMILVLLIAFLFGLGSQYYGKFLSTIFKFEPNLWTDNIKINFHGIYAIITILSAIIMLCLSRLFLIKSASKRK